MTIQTTSVQQTANEILGTEAKSLYYLIITNRQGKKLTVNVGKKTHDEVQKLKEEENRITQIQEEETKKRAEEAIKPELPLPNNMKDEKPTQNTKNK